MLSIYYLSKVHDLGQAHKCGWVKQVMWEFMSIFIQAPHHRQETNTNQKETRKQKVTSIRVRVCVCGGGGVESVCVCECVCVCVCVCCLRCHTEYWVTVFLSYHVPYMFMFVLPLVRVRGVRSHKPCSTPPHIRVVVQSQEPHRH
jgi:hypothetical protein